MCILETPRKFIKSKNGENPLIIGAYFRTDSVLQDIVCKLVPGFTEGI